MSEAPFVVSLAGRQWELPHLPFRLIKSIQPALFKVYAETAREAGPPLAETQIDALSYAVWQALAHVAPALTFDEFLALPFSLSDLFSALPAIAQAAGLRLQPATAEASPETGKSTSTS